MKWKFVSYISFLLILPLLFRWYVDCKDLGETIIFSKDKKPVVTKTVDPLFGTETTKTVWKSGFWLGLLPNDDSFSYKALIGVAPIFGFLFVVGGLSTFMHYKHKKKIRVKKT
ncbi:MAG: hypothetical protein EPN82_06280 [Bacteroidetes bacterium]|nr:MAG: hypothetical protein EPN82_06280 [Bacteroidota bacterium]